MSTIEPRHEQAIERMKAKNGFKIHLLVYLIINSISVLSWAVSEAGKPLPAGFFWPVFLIVGWGVGLVAHCYFVYWGNAYPDEQIQRELKEPSSPSGPGLKTLPRDR